MSFFEQIQNLVKQIPKGKVTTYGIIAQRTGVNPRVVGWAMNANKDQGVPCHRVVFKDGSLAPGYAFGGEEEQKRKLIKEGVKFKNELQVDLEKSLFSPAPPKKIDN